MSILNKTLSGTLEFRYSRPFAIYFLLALLLGGCAKEKVSPANSLTQKGPSVTSSLYEDGDTPPNDNGGTGSPAGPNLGPFNPLPTYPPLYGTAVCYFCQGGAGYSPNLTGVYQSIGLNNQYYVRGTHRSSTVVSYPNPPQAPTLAITLDWLWIQQTTGRMVWYISGVQATSPGSLSQNGYKFVMESSILDYSTSDPNGFPFRIYYHFLYNQPDPVTGDQFTMGPTEVLNCAYDITTDRLTVRP